MSSRVAARGRPVGNFFFFPDFYYAESMTLIDAQQYDDARARRRRNRIIAGVIIGLILAFFAYHYRNFPQRHLADKFFTALQQQNFEQAFAIWNHDPDWKQHPEKFSTYSYGDFQRDWGTSSEWGIIKSHQIDCSYASGSGAIIQVTVNQRAEHAYVWVDKSDTTIHFSPNEIDCGNWWGRLTE